MRHHCHATELCDRFCRVRACIPGLILLVGMSPTLSGCSRGPTTFPVTGKVVFDDGNPLSSGAVVIFQETSGNGAAGTSPRGVVHADGTFELNTFEEGDGAPAGDYRVLVRAKRDPKDYTERGIFPRPVIDPVFEQFESSGLTYKVVEGTNNCKFVVRRAKSSPGKRAPAEP